VNPVNGELYKEGEKIKRPILASTLERLANCPDPVDLFYNGPMADDFAKEFQKNGSALFSGHYRFAQRANGPTPLCTIVFRRRLHQP
jgi:Gamma-glutamyltranspeptidase